MSAAAANALGGVQLLILAAVAGEFTYFRANNVSSTAWPSLIYLIIAGSIVGFTAYVWLLHYESPTDRNLRLCQPGSSGNFGSHAWWRKYRPKNHSGRSAHPDQRGRDHYDQTETGNSCKSECKQGGEIKSRCR